MPIDGFPRGKDYEEVAAETACDEDEEDYGEVGSLGWKLFWQDMASCFFLDDKDSTFCRGKRGNHWTFCCSFMSTFKLLGGCLVFFLVLNPLRIPVCALFPRHLY